MQNNPIFHANPGSLFSSVNKSVKEQTVICKWSTFNLSGLANTENALSDLFEAGLPCVDAIPSPSDSSAKLFSVTNHIDKIDGKKAALMYLYFYQVSVQSSGGAEKTALEVNNAIKDSTLVSNMAFNQTVIRNSAMISVQPNWFRPKFVINENVDYFNLDSTSGENPTGTPSGIFKPEFAIGLNLPFEESAQMKALKVYESIDQIDVYAQCFQKIKVGSDWVYQQYPLFCEARFIVED